MSLAQHYAEEALNVTDLADLVDARKSRVSFARWAKANPNRRQRAELFKKAVSRIDGAWALISKPDKLSRFFDVYRNLFSETSFGQRQEEEEEEEIGAKTDLGAKG